MIAIQEDDGRIWWCPHLELHEAHATVGYWRRLGISCEVVIVPETWVAEDGE